MNIRPITRGPGSHYRERITLSLLTHGPSPLTVAGRIDCIIPPLPRGGTEVKAALNIGWIARTVLSVAFVAVLGIGAFAYWEYSSRVRSTDNAYVNAELVQISSLVAGPVMAVYMQKNQYVRKGERLFDVDPKPFLVAPSKARAQLALARQGTQQDFAEARALDGPRQPRAGRRVDANFKETELPGLRPEHVRRRRGRSSRT